MNRGSTKLHKVLIKNLEGNAENDSIINDCLTMLPIR
jgi:hypothetical protein